MADEQQRAEATDDDKLPADYPPDRPLAGDDYGTTGAEQEWDEPLAERVQREVPDRIEPTEDRGEPLVEPNLVPGEEGELLGERAEVSDTASQRAGSTVTSPIESDEDVDEPAEEQAVHEGRPRS